MNIVHLFIIAYGSLICGFKGLGRSVRGLIEPDPSFKTPAVLMRDDRDYVPAPPFVLFGHHYMSIAGTSPIIASIVGLIWGWVPAILWMILGVLLLGGVHDYYALMLSVRSRARSMGEIVGERIGPFLGMMTKLVLGFGGILVYAIFLFIMVDTLYNKPVAGLPTLSLIPIAILFGVLIRRGMGILWVTLVGIFLTILAAYIGITYLPLKFSKLTWEIIFVSYTFIAVYSPVWILLQPRDYLNFSVLAFGMLLGLIGLILGMPEIKVPAFTSFVTERGPLWPILFVTISCGAASGWHSLIAAGTTSKQLRNEMDGYRIAYGGMIGETVLALLSAGMMITAFTYPNLVQRILEGSIGPAFAEGLGRAMEYINIPSSVGVTIGALALSALTLTTLDSFARTGRYVIQEIGQRTPLKSPLYSTIFVVGLGYLLYKVVPFMDLWHGLVLGGLLLLLLPFLMLLVEKRKKFRFGFVIHVILPLIFLLPTTLSGLLYMIRKYWFLGKIKWISGLMVIFLLGLYLVAIWETFLCLKRQQKAENS